MSSNTIAQELPAGISGERSKYWIDDWRPEDEAFWTGGGERVAKRNLAFSIVAEHIGFSVWTLWAVFVLFMGTPYGFDPSQKLLLTALPAAAA
jgi:MFS transporter, NNP family, nitrate/nitrite transporter